MSQQSNIEEVKFLADYVKHLTTLSTGSILVIATFLEKLFARPHWKWAVIAALVGFLISVLGAVGVFTALTFVMSEVNLDNKDFDADTTSASAGKLSLSVTWIGFCMGLLSLTLFTIKNLMAMD